MPPGRELALTNMGFNSHSTAIKEGGVERNIPGSNKYFFTWVQCAFMDLFKKKEVFWFVCIRKKNIITYYHKTKHPKQQEKGGGKDTE